MVPMHATQTCVFTVKDTGQAAYRIMLRRDQMAHDPELLTLVESNTTFRWINARRHGIVSLLFKFICLKNIYSSLNRTGVPHFR
jgi:hypothetical protein